MLSSASSKIIVIWVLGYPSVHERPCDPVDSILFILNSGSNHIGIEVVM